MRRGNEKPESPGFPLFQELPESVQYHVFSFVAKAPLEKIFGVDSFHDSAGALAKTLPLVCKKFRDFSRSEPLWQASLERAIARDKVWSEALSRMGVAAPHNLVAARNLIPTLLASANVSTCKNLYQVILNENIRVRLPIFFMPMEFDKATPNPRYQLHFFEPRYRIMMAELMRGFEQDPGDDGPVFLHVVDMRGPRAKAGALVRIRECAFAPDGRAMADLQVIGSVRLKRCWVRPQSYSLYYGEGYRCDDLPLVEPIPHNRWSYRDAS
eukprot:scaffold2992_cov214-Amphora_coffeaeformis.AAC.48